MSKLYYLASDDIPVVNIDHIYYFDNNSTTLIYNTDVKNDIVKWISCGNPSNTLHDFGLMAHNTIETCRHSIARQLLIEPSELYFTSGATESNNIVVQGVVHKYIENIMDNIKYTIITSSFEHPSVLNITKHFENNKHLDIIYLNPCNTPNDNDYGRIKVIDVYNAINNAKYPVILVSIMYANNETGAIQDIKEIGKICNKHNIFFHSDVTQALGKFILHPKKLYIDAISFSAHKFHGPKGVGGLYISNKQNNIMNLCFGGEQEHKKRPGTENVSNIVGMARALEIVHSDRINKNKLLYEMSKYILTKLREKEDIELLGPQNWDYRLPNTLLIKINNLGKCNKLLVKELNKHNIYISVGSACQTEKKASHVLSTLGIEDKKDQLKVVRISLSDYTTFDECDYLIKHMFGAIEIQRNI